MCRNTGLAHYHHHRHHRHHHHHFLLFLLLLFLLLLLVFDFPLVFIKFMFENLLRVFVVPSGCLIEFFVFGK